MTATEIRVLGPIEVVGPEGSIAFRGRLAALLAILVAERGHAVAVDTLVEHVFDGDPPPSAVSTLHGYIHRLRKRAPGTVESLPAGYRLAVTSFVDADLFETERSEGLAAVRAGDLDRGRARLAAALGRWRGHAFDCFSDREYAHAEAVRLEELLRQTEDDYLDLRCSTEPADCPVADLEASVRAEPSRERRWAMLISALQRSGRPSDATAAATRFRTWLREEFQVTPTPEFEMFATTLFTGPPRDAAPGATAVCDALVAGARAALDAAPSIPLGVAAEIAFDAARRLVALRHLEPAQDLYGRVLEAVGDADPRRAVLAHLGRAEVRARSSASDWTESLDAAIDLARRFGHVDLLVQAALLNPRGVMTGVPSRIDLLRSLLSEIPPNSPDRPALLAQHALETLGGQGSGAHGATMAEALDASRTAENDRVRIQVAAAALNDSQRFIPPEQRRALATELDELAARAGDGEGSWLAAAHLYWAAIQQARGDDAAAALQMVEARGPTGAVIAKRDFARHVLAIDAYLGGRLDDADAHLSLAFPDGPRDDGAFGIDRANRDGVLLRLRREQGRIAEVLPLVSGDLPPFPAVTAASARALVAAECGDADTARSALERCRAERDSPALYLPHLRTLRLEAAALIGDVERAVYEADRLLPYAGQVLCGTRGCDGAVDRYIGLAASAAGDHAACDRWLRSALTIHERLGRVTLIARTLYDRARLLSDSPARDRALDLARRHRLTLLRAQLS